MKKDINLDFAWGNPYFLLDILNKQYVSLLGNDVSTMSYAPDTGIPALVDLTKEVILHTTGNKYDYVFLTNGATQGISSILKYYKQAGYDTVCTNKYGYPFYGDMIRHAGLSRVESLDLYQGDFKSVFLIDSPSNPQGIQSLGYSHTPTVWDAVYHNKIYTDDIQTHPKHDIMVSSYSKLLGLTGARVGFVATNCPLIHQVMSNYSWKDIATVSVPSQRLIIDVLNKVNLDDFMKLGKQSLDYNREEFRKLEYLFDYQPVSSVGMFYCAYADNSTIDLLNKCRVKYVKLEDDYIRLSMGQSLDVTKQGVKTILKMDKA